MHLRALNNLLQGQRNIKKQLTLRKEFDITSVPVLVRNKSCECDECGGIIKKQIEECQKNDQEENYYAPKIIAQHERQKSIDISTREESNVQKRLLYYFKTKKIQLLNNIESAPLISPTLEQPKRDIQKLNRLIEKYDTRIEQVQQVCKTLPDVVMKPKQRNLQRQKTKHYSFIRILPLVDDEQMSSNSQMKDSQQRTPYRNQVYKELNGSTMLRQLQTPIFRKSKFYKNPIIDFADGMRKAMDKIKELDEQSNVSKIISTQLIDDTKLKSRNSLLLKSFLDCTKLIDNNPSSLKKLDVFLRPKNNRSSQSRYVKNSSPVKVYLPYIPKK